MTEPRSRRDLRTPVSDAITAPFEVCAAAASSDIVNRKIELFTETQRAMAWHYLYGM